MKRVLSFLLALALLLTVIPAAAFTARAAEAPQLSLHDVSYVNYGKTGETIEVALDLSGNPGILGAEMVFTYDQNLTLTKAVVGEVFEKASAYEDYTWTAPKSMSRSVATDGTQTYTGSISSPCTFLCDAMDLDLDYIKDGTVLTLTFQVSADAQPWDEYSIGLTLDDAYEGAFTVSTSYDVLIIDYQPGDVNADGRINAQDATLIRQYIVDGRTYDPDGYAVELNESAADVTGDGIINTKDVTWIRQYIVDGRTYDPNGYGISFAAKKPACAHTMEATEATEATCETDGNIAYWYCTTCNKYFTDAEGTEETDQASITIPATGHDITVVAAKDPTYTTVGWYEWSYCENCGIEIVEKVIRDPLEEKEYTISYDIYRGDLYLLDLIGTGELTNPNPDRYTQSSEIELEDLAVPGYEFLGWFDGTGDDANQVIMIENETGNKRLYAKWQKMVYKVTFDSPDIPVESVTYTVDTGVTLESPKCFGYTFVGWSNDDGFLVSSIKPGSTGHITLHANWTSNRNKATSYTTYDAPLIIEDNINGQFLFVYNIGKIENVPLNLVQDLGYSDGLSISTTYEVTDTVDEGWVEQINKMAATATTLSSGWTLAKEWNDIYESQEEVGELKEKSDERTTSEGTVVGGKYFVSNSEGGSTYVSTESGGSSSNSSKVTTDKSVGINTSYDTTTETYCDATLGVSNTTEVGASVEVPVGIGKASASVKNTTTIESEVSSGRKDTSAYHIDGSLSSYVGTVDYNEVNDYYNSSVSNSSTWNSTSGYEQSQELTTTEEITSAIKEQISQTTTHSLSKALGETNTETEARSDESMSSEEYSTSLTYNKGTQETVTKTFQYTSTELGNYRIITAGTIHVYALVGYDVATESYYTSCFNILDDTTREILDFSKSSSTFDDCENGVVTFDVPIEVNEYICGVVGKTDGLEISHDGEVTNFTASEYFGGTVVVPQYDSKDNLGSTPSAIKVTSLSSTAFAGNEDIEVVVLPLYITEIPDGAFAGCTNLKQVIAYGVTKIGADAFKGCTSLEKFYIDNAIVSLGDNAFEGVSEIAVTAYDSAVAEAAFNSGAANISVNISKIVDSFDNRVVTIGADIESFVLIGDGGTYNNVQIDSAAASTMINYMTFANNTEPPLKLASTTVILARVVVESSPSFALVLTADDAQVQLYGTVTLSSAAENVVLSKNVTLSQYSVGTTSKMNLSGNYLVCGEVVNPTYLNVEPLTITADEYEGYLNASTVTFDANGGTTDVTSKTVYNQQCYGTLPVPERTYYQFLGWYTEAEGGELVTETTVVSTVVNHTLYAHWEALAATLTFDANGGIVDTAETHVYIGSEVGDLPLPTRDYYDFAGWYTDAEDGELITAETVLTAAEDLTLYAHWELKPASEWVLASEVPADAQIVDTKYSYILTSYTTSSSSSLSGWTLYNTTSEWSEYGSWSSWSKTAATASTSRQVETKTVTDQAAYTNYRYWIYRTTDGYGYGTKNYQTSSHGYCTQYDEINLKYSLSVVNSSLGLYGYYDSSMFSHSYDNQWFFGEATAVAAVTHTEYRYRDRTLIYTYYYTMDETLESSTYPTGDNISNIQELVQYREK